MTHPTYIQYVVYFTNPKVTGPSKETFARGAIGGHGERIVRLLHPGTVFNNNDIIIPLACLPIGGSEGFRDTLSAALLFAFLFAYSSEGVATPPCEAAVGEAVSVQGLVEFNRASQPTWQAVTQGEPFCVGDSVRAASRSRAAILLANQTLIRLDEDTAVTFSAIEPAEPSWLDLLKGAIHFLSRTRQSFKVKTPFVNAAIEGTEFVVRVTPNETGLWVYEGVVAFGNSQGSLTLRSGEAAVTKAGKAPARRIAVDPLDAVQWALYYPPVIDYRAAAQATGPDWTTIVAALADYRRNDLSAAFARLDAVPEIQRSAAFYTLRAGLLLSVGRVDQAQPDIDQALALEPNNGAAHALRSIIALTRNDTEKALSLAEQGARLDPQSSVPRVALSYAHQARFDIQQARDSASQAVNLSPEDAMAWARLSELELSLGELDKALAAARQAVSLDPGIARTQTILGFAHLTQVDVDEAKSAFQKAIKLDQAAPLPRLGLGLATIRAGDLDKGVHQLEIAASLDPDNSLIRSYLGKGYYEQKREKLAATEFEIAKRLDPQDPTPHFYDAILKQTTNRPVEALRDLQKSIELNDNRAVYRSRLMLDQDQATRGTSLARIYDDLGFDQIALVQAAESLSIDPANHSAHRFLSDTYARLPRHEIARVSELLQSQLLQPINGNPVQPRLAISDLNIVTGAGPGQAAFNEFNSSFERNRLHLVGSGLVGNNNALGNELVLSGLYDRLSFSLGQLHSETDGFRPNNDIQNDLYNVFAQLAVTPTFNVQAEYIRRETDHGDLVLFFDPNDFLQNDRRTLKQDSVRLGTRFAPSPQSDLVFSFAHNDRDEDQLLVEPDSEGRLLEQQSGHQIEGQYLFRGFRYNMNLGGGFNRVDVDMRFRGEFFQGFDDLAFDREQDTIYAYSNFSVPDDLTWTVGLSYESFRESRFEENEFNPKLGLHWNVTKALSLRLAYFETLKRSIIFDQTIEPTQVAGFNQFFDDFNGTKTTRYGIGIDSLWGNDIYSGLEISRRDLDVPLIDPEEGTAKIEDQEENLYRAYFYWTPREAWALRAEVRFERFKHDAEPEPGNENPVRVNTFSIPLTLGYFNPSGFFAQVTTTYVHQEVDRLPTAGSRQGSDNFVLVDPVIGYRLPRHWGYITLETRNIFNENFMYQDDDFRTSETKSPLYVPGRTILGRMTLNF